MKPVSPAAKTLRTILALSIIAVAATLTTACNRDSKNPAGNSPALKLTPTAASAGSSPEQHLADALANVWDLIGKIRAGEKALADWSVAQAGTDSPSRKARQRFIQASQVLFTFPQLSPDAPPRDPVSYQARLDRIAALLEKQRPESAKKWRDKTFEPILSRFGLGLIIGWDTDPAPDPKSAMTVEEANQAVIDFCLLAETEFIEPGLKTTECENQFGEHVGPEVDRCFKETFRVTTDEWLAGQGPADFDFPTAIHKLLAQYHPDIASLLPEFFAERFAHEVKSAQDAVKNHFAKIATAEQSFVDHMLAGKGIYWTPDLAGLYRFQPADNPIKLIDAELARLDARPANFTNEAPLPAAPAPDAENPPKFGFAAVRGADGAALDGHHYAFCAWPLGYGRIGRQTYLLVDPGNLFVKDTEGKPVDRLPANLEADGWASIDFQPPKAAAAAEAAAPVKPVVTPEMAFADPDPSVRIDGLNRLMGVADEHAAPPSDPAARRISPAAAKALAAMFGDKNEFVRRRACEVARFFGKAAIAEAKPVILQDLKSEDSVSRITALMAVKDLKIRSDEFAAIIVKLTASDDHDESNYAFDALVIQKLDDATTGQMIVDVGDHLELGNVYPTFGDIRFLGSRGALSIAFADKLRDIAGTPDEETGPCRQEDAAEAYFHISGDAAPYVEYLLAILRKSGFDRELMFKLAAIGPPAAAALPDLQTLLQDPKYDLDKPLIAYPIGRISGDIAATVAMLIPMVPDHAKSPDVLTVLEKLGPDAREAIDVLQEQRPTRTGAEREQFERTIAAVYGTPLEDN